MAYRKVDPRMWNSPTFRGMSEDARAMYQYLLTSPHNNALCCYILRPLYAADDLQWTPERVNQTISELLSKHRPDGSPMILYDYETNLVAVYGQLEKDGIINDNCAKACLKILETLPSHSNVYTEILRACESLNKSFLKSLIQSLRERLGKLPIPSPSPIPIPNKEEERSAKPPFVLLILKNGKEHPVYEPEILERAKAFPGLGIGGVQDHLLKMQQWCKDNPTKRKTPAGINRFITSWLSREEPDAPPQWVRDRAKDNPYLASLIGDSGEPTS